MNLVIRGAVLFITFLIFAISASAQKKKSSPRKKTDNTQLVDPFIGTQGKGHTYPGAVLPYGMVQLNPVTRTSGVAYQYADTVVYGFSTALSHTTDSTEQNEILFMPTTGTPRLNLEERPSV
ncbi:MAG: hypothetical protein EOP47_15225, partial [Sphingobacteriaceae bacterium]